MQDLKIKICNSPEEAPNYREQKGFTSVKWEEAIIVRNGTEEGRTTVDLILKDEKGNKYIAMITGRIVQQVAGLIIE